MREYVWSVYYFKGKKKLKLFNLGFNYEEYVDKVMYLLV